MYLSLAALLGLAVVGGEAALARLLPGESRAGLRASLGLALGRDTSG